MNWGKGILRGVDSVRLKGMETVARIFLIISVTVLSVVATAALYRYLSVVGHEAYDRPIEIPVIIERWRSPDVETSGTSSVPLID